MPPHARNQVTSLVRAGIACRCQLKTKVLAKTSKGASTLSRGDVMRQTAEKFETSAQCLALQLL